MISFLDVLLIHKQDGIDLAVFRKETNTDLYINWNAFAQDYLLEMELHYLETTFVEINNFPRTVFKRIFKHVRTEMNVVSNSATKNATEENTVEHKVVQLRGRKGRIHREGS